MLIVHNKKKTSYLKGLKNGSLHEDYKKTQIVYYYTVKDSICFLYSHMNKNLYICLVATKIKLNLFSKIKV